MSSVHATCRICGSSDLVAVLSLGSLPLANRLLTESQLADEEPAFPLDHVLREARSLEQGR